MLILLLWVVLTSLRTGPAPAACRPFCTTFEGGTARTFGVQRRS